MRKDSGVAPAPPMSGADRLGLEDVDSFESFYRRELPSLIALARALSRTPSLGDDLAQEAMLAAYRRWPEVSAMNEPTAWVRRVCANMATSHLRRLGVEARGLLRLNGPRVDAAPSSGLSEEVWAQVRRLPRRQAQSIALFYVYGVSVTEIAATLGCSGGSVKVHLSRGRATLAEALGSDRESGEGEIDR